MQSVVIVVSVYALITLKDQVLERNVRAGYVGEIDDATETEVSEGQLQLMFLSTEALPTNATWHDLLQSTVYQSNLVGLVVDEAHCVKK